MLAGIQLNSCSSAGFEISTTLVKIPVIKVFGIFYEFWYCKDHGNQGPDNQGLAVNVLFTFTSADFPFPSQKHCMYSLNSI